MQKGIMKVCKECKSVEQWPKLDGEMHTMLIGTSDLTGHKEVQKLTTYNHFKGVHIGLGRWLSE